MSTDVWNFILPDFRFYLFLIHIKWKHDFDGLCKNTSCVKNELGKQPEMNSFQGFYESSTQHSVQWKKDVIGKQQHRVVPFDI
jgi:hypothetical protein